MSVCPSSFDVVTFLISAEVTRIRRGMTGLDIYFVKGPNQGYRLDQHKQSVDESEMFFYNVMLPCLSLLPSVKSFSLSNRNEISFRVDDFLDDVYPRGYDPRNPILGHSSLSGMELVPARIRGDLPGWFLAPKYAKKIASEYINGRFKNKKIITLTSREANDFDVNKTRRVDIKNWEIIFDKCLTLDLQPVVIRDTGKAFSNTKLFNKEIAEIPLGSLHLPFRIAFYELSLLNFFTINGPQAVALWGANNSCHLYKFDNDSPPISEELYKHRFAMPEGCTFPMTTLNTSLLWNTQEPEDILKIIQKVNLNKPKISSKMHPLSNKKQLEYSLSTSMKCLLNDLTTGHFLNEDIKLIEVINNLFNQKVINNSPFEMIRSNEGKMSYADRLLPKGCTDQIISFIKKNSNNFRVA